MKAAAPLAILTKRQNEILQLLRRGLSNKDVARKLDISDGTVKQHLVEIYRRLKVNNRTMAAQSVGDNRDESVFLPSSVNEPVANNESLSMTPPAMFDASIQPVSYMRAHIHASETLINRLGSNGFSQLYQRLHQECQKAADRFAGVLQGSPNGILVLFGVKRLREDDPIRAIYCADSVIAALKTANSSNDDAIKICVNTGNIVAFSSGTKINIQGELLSNACQNADQQDESVIVATASSQALARLIDRYGPPSDHFSSGNFTNGPATEQFIAPFIGRYDELDTLQQMFSEACSGASGATIVTGEAGFGATRLLAQFQNEMTGNDQEFLWLSGLCHSTANMIPFHPFISILEQLAQCDMATAPFNRQEQLLSWITTQGLPMAHDGQRLLAFLLEREPAPRMRRGETLLDELTNFFVNILQGVGKPIIICFDNLQWMDPHTRVLLPNLAKALNNSQVWLLGAGRRAELRQLIKLDGFRHLPLSRLTGRESLRLLKQTPIAKRIKLDTLVELAQWSRGVPLFAIESASRLNELDDATLERTLQESDFFPDALLPLILERLHAVAGVDWKTTRALAALDESTSLYQLAALNLHGNREATQAAITHLLQAGLIKITGTKPDRSIEFSSTMVRSAIRKTLPESDLQAVAHNSPPEIELLEEW